MRIAAFFISIYVLKDIGFTWPALNSFEDFLMSILLSIWITIALCMDISKSLEHFEKLKQ